MYRRFFFLMLIRMSCMSAEPLKSLPVPTGPYQIGIAKSDLIDPSRKEIQNPDGRLVPILVYFPRDKGSHTLHPKIFEERAPDKWPPLQVDVYAQTAPLSLLSVENKHPVILLNHGDTVAMTDYACIAEDLASHGYVVVSIQHQLKTDPDEPKFWRERSISRYAKVVDNILFVFEWLKANLNDCLDLKKVGLLGHSMGGNSLLLLANRASSVFKQKESRTLLPHEDSTGVRESIIVMDTGGFPHPSRNQYPLFLLLAEERENYQKQSGVYDDMLSIGHQVKYYQGSKHISFMDHGYVNPEDPVDPHEQYFNGSAEERKGFFDEMRKDIRAFLKENGI